MEEVMHVLTANADRIPEFNIQPPMEGKFSRATLWALKCQYLTKRRHSYSKTLLHCNLIRMDHQTSVRVVNFHVMVPCFLIILYEYGSTLE